METRLERSRVVERLGEPSGLKVEEKEVVMPERLGVGSIAMAGGKWDG